MKPPTAFIPAPPTRLLRRIVLGTAFLLGVAVALAPRTPVAQAQQPAGTPVAAAATTAAAPGAAPAPATAAAGPGTAPVPTTTAPNPAAKSFTITDGSGREVRIDVSDKARAGAPPAEAAPGAAAEAATPADGAGSTAAETRETPRQKRARVIVDGSDGSILATDREFDSFEQFVHNEPALAGMVIAIVAVVFFAPVLAIALILWYRMRKARMLNETMLTLAEKGIVPPADALDALAGGKPPAAVAPYYEQTKQIRRRAAWSDLRKGVLMGGFGLALSVYSLLEDREPNVLGLVLLFVGLGFVVLWWFEERQLAPPNRATPGAAPGPGSGSAAGSPPPA